LRDSNRCAVPGCRHAIFVDVHHLHLRADGGDHRLENLVTLCAAHHRMVHRGALLVEHDACGGFRFRHGDGSDYGSPKMSPALAVTRATAFRALRALGFRETEARQALERVAVRVTEEPTTEALLRAALLELTATVAA
jgi:hypothetical protein